MGVRSKIVLPISFSWVEISLNNEFELPMFPAGGPKVCGGGGGWVVV